MVGIATHEAEDRYGGIRGVGKKLTDGIPRKTKPDTEKATEGDGDKTKGTADLAKVAIDGAKSSGVVATAGAGKEKDDGDDERKEETEKPKKRKTIMMKRLSFPFFLFPLRSQCTLPA